MCLCFTNAVLKLQGYVDADLADDVDNKKSTIGFVFSLGRTIVSWASNQQKIFALSTIKAKNIISTEAVKDMIWLQSFLDEFGKKLEKDILHIDSQTTTFLSKNSTFHSKLKHIQMRYNFIHYLLQNDLLKPEKIYESKNPADTFIKGVTIEKLKMWQLELVIELKDMMMSCSDESLCLEVCGQCW